MTHSTEPLEIKTEHGPSSKANWTPYELNLKYPILNTEQWTFTGTRFIAKEISPSNLLISDPWFRPFRKWCMDDKVWTKDKGRGRLGPCLGPAPKARPRRMSCGLVLCPVASHNMSCGPEFY